MLPAAAADVGVKFWRRAASAPASAPRYGARPNAWRRL